MQRNITLHPFWCTQIQLARQLNNNYSIRINSFVSSSTFTSYQERGRLDAGRLGDLRISVFHVQRQWTPFSKQSCVSSSTHLIHRRVGSYYQYPHCSLLQAFISSKIWEKKTHPIYSLSAVHPAGHGLGAPKAHTNLEDSIIWFLSAIWFCTFFAYCFKNVLQILGWV